MLQYKIKSMNLSTNLILKYNLNDFKHFNVFKVKWESKINFTISPVTWVEIKIPLTQFRNKRKFNFDKASLPTENLTILTSSLKCGLY